MTIEWKDYQYGAGAHALVAGLFRIDIPWESGKFRVKVAGATLKSTFDDLSNAQAAALAFLRARLNRAIAEIGPGT